MDAMNTIARHVNLNFRFRRFLLTNRSITHRSARCALIPSISSLSYRSVAMATKFLLRRNNRLTALGRVIVNELEASCYYN